MSMDQDFRKIKIRSAQVQIEGAAFSLHNCHITFSLEAIRIDLFSDFELVAAFSITDRAAVNHTPFHDSIVVSNPDHATVFCLQFFSGQDKVAFVQYVGDLIQFFKAKRRSVDLQDQARELLGRKFALPAKRVNGGVIMSPSGDQDDTSSAPRPSPSRNSAGPWSSGGEKKDRQRMKTTQHRDKKECANQKDSDRDDDDDDDDNGVSSPRPLDDVDRINCLLGSSSHPSHANGGEEDDPRRPTPRKSRDVRCEGTWENPEGVEAPPFPFHSSNATNPRLEGIQHTQQQQQQQHHFDQYNPNHSYSSHAPPAIFRDAFRFDPIPVPVQNRNFDRPYVHLTVPVRHLGHEQQPAQGGFLGSPADQLPFASQSRLSSRAPPQMTRWGDPVAGSSFFVDPAVPAAGRQTLTCRWCRKWMESIEHERLCEWRIEPCRSCGAFIEAKLMSAHRCAGSAARQAAFLQDKGFADESGPKIFFDKTIESDAVRKAKDLLKHLEQARKAPPVFAEVRPMDSFVASARHSASSSPTSLSAAAANRWAKLRYAMPLALGNTRPRSDDAGSATPVTPPPIEALPPSLASFVDVRRGNSMPRKPSTRGDAKQRRCVWCNNPAPEVHDAQCNFRKLRCKRCSQQIYLKDKMVHRAECPNRN
jgi:hypothetical protein